MEHYAAPPEWGWYIVWYFFLGGIAGGTWFLGALLRIGGDAKDEPAARLAFALSFVAMAICPVLLTLDLGAPSRFWHMMVDSGDGSINFKPASPMSLGVWVLLLFGAFATLTFVDLFMPLVLLRRGAAGRAFHAVGAALGLLLAGYTGVLLSVSNQPLWSDSWALGGLFLASGLSVATAALALLTAWRRTGSASTTKLARADRWFLTLELALLLVFFATLGRVGPHYAGGRWIVLWLLVLAGIVVPLAVHRRTPASAGAATGAALLVLVSGLALRIAVVFAPQVG